MIRDLDFFLPNDGRVKKPHPPNQKGDHVENRPPPTQAGVILTVYKTFFRLREALKEALRDENVDKGEKDKLIIYCVFLISYLYSQDYEDKVSVYLGIESEGTANGKHDVNRYYSRTRVESGFRIIQSIVESLLFVGFLDKLSLHWPFFQAANLVKKFPSVIFKDGTGLEPSTIIEELIASGISKKEMLIELELFLDQIIEELKDFLPQTY